MHFSIQKTFYWLGSIIALFFVLKWSKFILAPVAFAFLLAFMLYPICRFWERRGLGVIFSIVLTYLLLLLLISGLSTLFSSQLFSMSQEFSNFGTRIEQILNEALSLVRSYFPSLPKVTVEDVYREARQWLSSKAILSDTLGSLLSFITSLGLVLVFTFIILAYRQSFVRVAEEFAPPERRESFVEMLRKIQEVGKKYITGISLLILILSIANSVGLLIIGLDYAIFFGILAAFLTIIPYVGTTFGGFLPMIYALIHHDSYGMAISVVVMYALIQFFENNFLNPIIVGGEVSLNPFVSIISLIVGGAIWDLAGIAIALPLVAVFKVICEHYDQLRPIGHFLGDEYFYQKKEERSLPFSWSKLKRLGQSIMSRF